VAIERACVDNQWKHVAMPWLTAGCYCCLVQKCDGMLGSVGNGHRKRVKHFDEPGHCHELTFSCYRRMSLLTNNVWRRMCDSQRLVHSEFTASDNSSPAS